MRNRREGGKPDANQAEIVKAFRKAGASVKIVSQVRGFVDLVVGLAGVTELVEVKDPDKPKSARKLTEPEQKFWDEHQGKSPVLIETVDDVMELCNAMRNTAVHRSSFL